VFGGFPEALPTNDSPEDASEAGHGGYAESAPIDDGAFAVSAQFIQSASSSGTQGYSTEHKSDMGSPDDLPAIEAPSFFISQTFP